METAREFTLRKYPELQQYEVSGRAWVMRNDLKEHQLWTTQWWCDDGDGVELYIEKDKGGFELNCFSGIPASKIYIDVVDFGVLWNKAFGKMPNEVKPIKNYTHVQQCIMLADWLCGIFCEWTDCGLSLAANAPTIGDSGCDCPISNTDKVNFCNKCTPQMYGC